jgi:hypothetical protein
VEDARACMRLYKVFTREIGIYPVRIVWNSIFGSKEARYAEPAGCGVRNLDEICGPQSELLKITDTDLGEPSSHISVAYQWGINTSNEKELIRVSIVNF